MAYRSDIAVQFASEEIANQFISNYENRMKDMLKNPSQYFSTYSPDENPDDFVNENSIFDPKYITEVVKLKHGSIAYFWNSIKFYDSFPEVEAFIRELETDKYSAYFIQIGEETTDIEEIDYGDCLEFEDDAICVERSFWLPPQKQD